MKNYSVTLDSEIVIKAKEKIKSSGGKLSPLLNQWLKKFIEGKKE